MRYNTGEREGYWTMVGETLKKINTKDCLIWGKDNNGLVDQRNKWEHDKNKSVRKWTLSKQTEQGNGVNLVGKCNKNNLKITDSTCTPKRGKRETRNMDERGAEGYKDSWANW